MYLLNSEKVLCLSSNCGDVEYSLYGTMIKNFKTKFTILVLDENVNSKLEKESRDMWDAITNVDGTFGSIDDIKTYIENCDFILTPSNEDLDVNRSRVYQHGLNKFITEGISFGTYKTITNYSNNFNINIDVSGQYNKKLILLENFESYKEQDHFKKSYIDGFNTNTTYSNLFGKKIENINLIGMVK